MIPKTTALHLLPLLLSILAAAAFVSGCTTPSSVDEGNNGRNNGTNNGITDPCSELSADVCETDPRCTLEYVSSPCDGEVCPDIAQVVCVSYGCFSDGECPSGYLCQFAPSGPSTGTDSGAAAPDEKAPVGDAASGYCVLDETPPSNCYADSDCGPHQTCQFTMGVPCLCEPCADGTMDCPCDCGGGDRVAPPGVCIDRVPDCWSDADCGPGQVCEFVDGFPGEQDCACEPCGGADCAPCDCGGGGAIAAPGGYCTGGTEPTYECQSDLECGGGICEFGSFCPENGPCVEYSECLFPHPDCGDGQPILCDALPPECAPGLVVVGLNGCYACVDPSTCEPVVDNCQGAFLDAAGVCRAPDDGIYPSVCCEGQPNGCDQPDAASCSAAGCFWWRCPDDLDCDLGAQCQPARELTYASGVLLPDCAPNDGFALRLMLGNNAPLTCDASVSAANFLEAYLFGFGDLFAAAGSFSVSLNQSSAGWGSIRFCPADAMCEDVDSGVLYMERRDDGTAAGQLYMNTSTGTYFTDFDVPFCSENPTFCG